MGAFTQLLHRLRGVFTLPRYNRQCEACKKAGEAVNNRRGKRLGAALLCGLLLFFAATPPALAETEKTAAVSGMVADDAGLGLVSQVIFTGDGLLRRVNTDMLGRFSLRLPLGTYTMEITKGSEYERLTVPVNVADRKAKTLGAYTLERLYATDWLAGDLHQHSVYSFDGKNSPAEIVLSDLAAGLSFGVLTDHNDVRGNAEYLTAARYGFLPVAGVEVTTDRGHFNAIHCNVPIDWSTANGAQDVSRIIAAVRAVPGALVQINHPTRTEFPFVDTALTPQFDLYELWNGKRAAPYVEGEPNALALKEWFALLNEGLFLPATAGSDNHDIDGNLLFSSAESAAPDALYYLTSMYSGMPRTYAYAPEKTVEAVLAALSAGHSFLTNNPLAYFTVNGAMPGEAAPAGDCLLRVRLQSNRGLTKYRIYVNGELWLEEAVAGMEVDATHSVSLAAGDWAVLMALGEFGDCAITNPVFIK